VGGGGLEGGQDSVKTKSREACVDEFGQIMGHSRLKSGQNEEKLPHR